MRSVMRGTPRATKRPRQQTTAQVAVQTAVRVTAKVSVPAPPPWAGPLLAWFTANARPLPWRTSVRDPYRTWLSEVLAQQTRLEVVVPRYEQFLRRFPTLSALAQAPLDDVLAAFSGLGYYARARNLHAAAREAWSSSGSLPTTCAALRELPGFGPYTAAAVASLSFGEQVPLVDGNVARVLARILRLPGDAQAVRQRAWELAPALLPPGRAGAFNEALMELGALVCAPRAPRCVDCPVRPSCGAALEGDATSFPSPKPRRERPILMRAALCLRRADGAVLLERQPARALFAGLWDLPAGPIESPQAGTGSGVGTETETETAALAVARALGASLKPVGVLLAGPIRERGGLCATLTHRILRVRLFSAPARPATPAPPLDPDRFRWVAWTAAGFARLGLSSLAQREFAHLAAFAGLADPELRPLAAPRSPRRAPQPRAC